MQKHIVLVTGSRAEWGLLSPLYHGLRKAGLKVTLLVTGSHLHSQSGFTRDEIDAQLIDKIIEVYITPENANTDSQSLMFMTMGRVFTVLAPELQTLKPDLVVVLGDRYEIFAVAAVCRLMGIRLAHISGGELTLGAFDDCLRHCITKLSDWHFTAAEAYRNRVIQLGENPNRVFNVGDVGLYRFHEQPFKSRSDLNKIVAQVEQKFILLTLHPETCNPGVVSGYLHKLIRTLAAKAPGHLLIFTGANADPEGKLINDELLGYSTQQPAKIAFYASLGRINYLSLARFADCVIGNSSSGMVEIPELAVPVINLGQRQCGRIHGQGVISVPFVDELIETAIMRALTPEFKELAQKSLNPYQGVDSIDKIVAIIASPALQSLKNAKAFYDIKQ